MGGPADTGAEASPRLPFLEALGLDGGADERAVRRAYAKRLKALDVEADPRGFQSLREAYEASLGWLAWRERQAAEAAAAPVAEATHERQPEPRPEAPNEAPPEVPTEPPPAGAAAQPDLSDGQAVYEAFAAHAAAVFADEAAAKRALGEALADPRLVNLEARTYFEWCVGCLLMNGWKPGHEFLFRPACDAFDWAHDRRRLALYGNLGIALDRAIEERLLFYRQPAGSFEAQRGMIRRLREEAMPSDAELRDQMPTLLGLAQRFPNWLTAITSMPNLRRWHERFGQLAPQPRVAHRPTPAFEPGPAKSDRPWMPLLMLMGVLAVMANFMGSQRVSRPATAEELRRLLPPDARAAPAPGRAPWQPAPPAGGTAWQAGDPTVVTFGSEAPRRKAPAAAPAPPPARGTASAPAALVVPPAPATRIGDPPIPSGPGLADTWPPRGPEGSARGVADRLPSLSQPAPPTSYELVPRGADPASAPRLGP